MTTTRSLVRLSLIALLAAVPFTLLAQQAPPAAQAPQAPAPPVSWADKILQQETYATPPPELASAVLAPRHLNTTLGNLSPDNRWFMREVGDGPVVMATFARPFDELGGLFLDRNANRSRALTIRNNVAIEVIAATDGTRRTLTLPAGARVSGAQWSPTGTHIAFLMHGTDATHIWVADTATLKARQVSKTPVLATMTSSVQWTMDGTQVAAVFLPDGRAARPAEPVAPLGPEVSLALTDERNRLRTYASLMRTQHDFELLEWHATGQMALINIATQAVKKFGTPQMFRSFDLSPDGQHARITRMTTPFSYIVPAGNIGQVEEVWDATGKALIELSSRPLNLGVQAAGGGGGRGGDQGGRRELSWRSDGQGFTYVEQEPAPAPPACRRRRSPGGAWRRRGTAGWWSCRRRPCGTTSRPCLPVVGPVY